MPSVKVRLTVALPSKVVWALTMPGTMNNKLARGNRYLVNLENRLGLIFIGFALFLSMFDTAIAR